MNINIDLNTLATIGVGGLVTWGLRGIRHINCKLNEMNGSIRELKVWRNEHTKFDDERHEDIKERLSRVETKP